MFAEKNVCDFNYSEIFMANNAHIVNYCIYTKKLDRQSLANSADPDQMLQNVASY